MPPRLTPPPRGDGLTDKQRDALSLIYEDARDRGYQPSMGEIAEVLGVGTRQAASRHLRALHRKGWIRLPARGSRSIELLRRPDGSPFAGFAEKPREDRA